MNNNELEDELHRISEQITGLYVAIIFVIIGGFLGFIFLLSRM